MSYYLLLTYIEYQTKYAHSLLTLSRLIRETLFKRKNFIDILTRKPERLLAVQNEPIQLARFNRTAVILTFQFSSLFYLLLFLCSPDGYRREPASRFMAKHFSTTKRSIFLDEPPAGVVQRHGLRGN